MRREQEALNARLVAAVRETQGRVKVEDFNMPFMALVLFLVKMALAAIPASIILVVIWGTILFALSLALAALGGGLGILGALFN
jgi:hypothetical protein